MQRNYILIFFTFNWSTKVDSKFFIRFGTIYQRLPFRRWYYRVKLLTSISTGFAVCRLIVDFLMHIGPKCILSKGNNTPTDWMCEMQGLRDRVSDRVWNRHAYINTDTPRASVQVSNRNGDKERRPYISVHLPGGCIFSFLSKLHPYSLVPQGIL